MIVLSAVNSKLLLEIKKRIKFMRRIEVFIIFAVRTLDFAIVPRCKRLNELVANAKFLQFHLKQVRSGFIRNELLCKLGSVVCLDALDRVFTPSV
mgnify:CR=1 FL=1